MNAIHSLVPRATTMIRADHAAVMATFHKYRPDASPSKKKAIVETICNAVEIYTKLEEEIFYPAMRRVQPDLVEKSGPEHNEMRRQIAHLRTLDPAQEEYDLAFLALMRQIIHHVADEETILLPAAERVLAEDLGEMGTQMTKRRMELAAPRAGEIALNAARSHAGLVATAVALLAVGGYLVYRESTQRTAMRWLDTRRMQRLAQRPAKRLLGYVRHA